MFCTLITLAVDSGALVNIPDDTICEALKVALGITNS